MTRFTATEEKLLGYINAPDLSTSLENIRQAVEKVWGAANPRIIKGYTDHGIPHSVSLAEYALKLLEENKGRRFSSEELYLLLAGIYLHDIGMQCDVVQLPEIKTEAERLGAVFDVVFQSHEADNYPLEEQKEIRKNHQYLSVAWIHCARLRGETILEPAAKTIPSDLVKDLMAICMYHSRLPIYDCPVNFKHDTTQRLQLVASLLRFADELDIDASRVDIETVKNFALSPHHSIYWWIHNCTKVNIDQNLIYLKILLHPKDAGQHGAVIHTAFITEFQTKNRPVLEILVANRIPIVISRDSGVEENLYSDPLPPEILEELQKLQQTYDPRHPVFFVPFRSKGDQLVGRDDALETVRRELTRGRRTSIGQAVAFGGMGGLGKTQLAVEYAYRFHNEYPSGIIWLNADQDLDAQLIEIAEKARWIAPESEHHHKLDVALKRIRNYSDCLIIFDNVENLETINKYLPEPQADPHILVTSRFEQPGFTPIPLDPLDEDYSLQMLFQEANRQPVDGEEREAAKDIVKALGGLPLALELAGAYLRHRPVGWREYHSLLQKNLQAAMPVRFLDSFTKHEAELYSTLAISEKVFLEEPLLKDILDLLTWSGSSPMGKDLLSELLQIQDLTTLSRALGLGEALRLLQKTPRTESYAIHRLVRAVGRETSPLTGRQDFVISICQRLGNWFQARREDFADLPRFEAEIDHLRAWQENALAYAPQQAPRLIWLQGYPPYHRGRYREAQKWVQEALELLESMDQPDPELHANLLNDLGTTCGRLANYRAQIDYHKRALAIRQEVLGERHPDTASSLNNVGTDYGDLGDYKKQLEYFEKALAIRQEVLGKRHPDTALSLNSVGTAYGELGDYNNKLEYQQKALAIRQEVLGERHPDTALSLNNVGGAFGKLGNYKRQLEYYQKALTIWQEVLGEKHPYTALSLNNVGTAFGYLGDHKRQLEYSQKALAISQELLGERHPDTALPLNNIGAAYGELGDHKRLLEYSQKALSIRQEVLGERHPDTARSLNNVGTAYWDLGERKLAREYLEKSLNLRRELLGDRHPDTVRNAEELAYMMCESGRQYPALQLINEFLGQLPQDHPLYSRLAEHRIQVQGQTPGFRKLSKHHKKKPKKKR